MQGFRLYEINFDALEDEILRTENRMYKADRRYDTDNFVIEEDRLNRLLKVKEWYKKRIIKFINTL